MLDPAALCLALPRPVSAGPLVRPALRACLFKDGPQLLAVLHGIGDKVPEDELAPVGQRKGADVPLAQAPACLCRSAGVCDGPLRWHDESDAARPGVDFEAPLLELALAHAASRAGAGKAMTVTRVTRP